MSIIRLKGDVQSEEIPEKCSIAATCWWLSSWPHFALPRRRRYSPFVSSSGFSSRSARAASKTRFPSSSRYCQPSRARPSFVSYRSLEDEPLQARLGVDAAPVRLDLLPHFGLGVVSETEVIRVEEFVGDLAVDGGVVEVLHRPRAAARLVWNAETTAVLPLLTLHR
jgi:hypothetical protein